MRVRPPPALPDLVQTVRDPHRPQRREGPLCFQGSKYAADCSFSRVLCRGDIDREIEALSSIGVSAARLRERYVFGKKPCHMLICLKPVGVQEMRAIAAPLRRSCLPTFSNPESERLPSRAIGLLTLAACGRHV